MGPSTLVRSCNDKDPKYSDCLYAKGPLWNGQSPARNLYDTYAINMIITALVNEVNRDVKGIADEQNSQKQHMIELVSKVFTEALQKEIVAKAAAQARAEVLQELCGKGLIPCEVAAPK